jgi:hypothetical protein
VTTTIITALAAAWIGFSAYSVLSRQAWAVDNFRDYGVPESWWVWLGLAKAAGALGLAVGIWIPAVGVAAAVGLVLYFTGAVVTVVRAKAYAHVPFPLLYLVPAAVAGLLIANG